VVEAGNTVVGRGCMYRVRFFQNVDGWFHCHYSWRFLSIVTLLRRTVCHLSVAKIFIHSLGNLLCSTQILLNSNVSGFAPWNTLIHHSSCSKNQ